MDSSHDLVGAMTMTLIRLYRLFKEHGGAFAREPNGDVSITLPEGVVLPADVDKELQRQQQDLVALALVIDLKEPRTWDIAAAMAEVAERMAAIEARIADVPKDSRAHVEHRARPIIARGKELVAAAFALADIVALRLALIAIEADLLTLTITAEQERGN